MKHRQGQYGADGMTQAEVAAALGCTRANVSMIQTRALRKLRRELEQLGVDAPAATGINWWGEAGDGDD